MQKKEGNFSEMVTLKIILFLIRDTIQTALAAAAVIAVVALLLVKWSISRSNNGGQTNMEVNSTTNHPLLRRLY